MSRARATYMSDAAATPLVPKRAHRQPPAHNEEMRCKQHDLVCGPDGRCVLCRREPAVGTGLASPRRSPALLLVGIAAALFAVAAGARVALRTPPASVEAHDPSPTVAAAVVPEEPTASAVRPVDALHAEQMRGYQAFLAANALSAAPSGSPAPSAPAVTPVVTATATASAATPAPASDLHVVMYTTSTCPVCKRAKAWMNAERIAYQERDVEESPGNAIRMRAINPAGSVPTFDVEGQVLVGFSPESLSATLERAAARRTRVQSL